MTLTQAAENAVSKELARACIQRALDHVQQAQNYLGRACAELSPIIGGGPTWRRGSKLYDSVHAFWYVVNKLEAQLGKRGGPLVDSVNLQAELERRAKARPSQTLTPEERAEQALTAPGQVPPSTPAAQGGADA